MSLRVGVDLVSVASIRDSIDRYGTRYLERTYTDGELADCRAAGVLSAESLAARFAAKEATMKALRLPPDEGLAWRSIEVVREEGGWTSLRLGGDAADLAVRQGVDELALSLSHEGDFAAAVVVACSGGSTS